LKFSFFFLQERLCDERFKLQVENQQLKVRENSLRKERESKMEFKESLEKSVEELSKKVSDGATQLGQLSKVMHAKKEELANARERETSSAARSEQLNEQVRLLKAQVVHNPEALFLVSSAARTLMYLSHLLSQSERSRKERNRRL
jgi:chromosome segregation ATPase